MTIQVGEFVRVFIDGTERTEYVVSYTRKDTMCEMGATFTVELDPSLPVAPDPYDSIEIREYFAGDLGTVLKGYSVEITRDFDPGTWIITGQDKSILLHEYFIDHQLISGGETVDYWINYIAGLAGFDVQFDATSPTAIVPAETALGLQTAGEIILTLERQAAYYVKYDASIDKLRVFRLGTSQPTINITTEDSLAIQQKLGTDKSRNVVRIYGGFKFDFLTGNTEQIFVKAKVTMPELLVDKSIVIANPAIRTYTSAYIVANRILDVTSSIDDIQTYLLEGFFPDIMVGDSTYVNVDFGDISIQGNQLITTIEAVVDKGNGVTTSITTGEKCPRLSVQLPTPPILVATDQDGVGISWNGGDSFLPSNIGLTTDNELYAWSVAANQYSQQMVITSGGVFRRFGTGGTWLPIPSDIPDPINSSDDSPPIVVSQLHFDKVVDHPIRPGTFHILANTSGALTAHRSWVYTTEDFGNSWASKQLYINKIPSGVGWTVTGLDIETSPVNNMYVLVNGVFFSKDIYFARQTATATWHLYTWDTDDGIIDQHTMTFAGGTGNTKVKIFSVPGNRGYAVALGIRTPTVTTKPWIIVAVTSDNGETWSTIHNAQITADLPTFEGDVTNYSIGNDFIHAFYDDTSSMRFFIPIAGAGKFYVSGPDGEGCYTRTHRFYEGAGFNVTVTNLTSVGVSTSEYSSSWDYTMYDKGTAVQSTSYLLQPGRPVIRNQEKYSNQIEYPYYWVGVSEVLQCTGVEYPEGDEFSNYYAKYADNPADDRGFFQCDSDTYPPGYTPYLAEGYDEGYFYTILYSGSIMSLYNGYPGTCYAIDFTNGYISGPETYLSLVLDAEVRAD